MEIINCRGCGRLFNYLGRVQLCPACQKELEEKYQQVKKYIYDNPRTNIQQVAEDNEVSVQQLRTWVREERLEFTDASLVGLNCESCGAMIRSGRLCRQCKDKMANTMTSLYQPASEERKKTNSGAKMRFLDT